MPYPGHIQAPAAAVFQLLLQPSLSHSGPCWAMHHSCCSTEQPCSEPQQSSSHFWSHQHRRRCFILAMLSILCNKKIILSQLKVSNNTICATATWLLRVLTIFYMDLSIAAAPPQTDEVHFFWTPLATYYIASEPLQVITLFWCTQCCHQLHFQKQLQVADFIGKKERGEDNSTVFYLPSTLQIVEYLAAKRQIFPSGAAGEQKQS